MTTLEQYGGPAWFRLGDRDLGTHLYRTGRLAEGATLSTVTAEIAAAWKLGVRLQPVTDDRLRTMITVEGEGEIGFQDYFVGRHHSIAVTSLRFDGATSARPAPGVIEAIDADDVIVIAPSNPLVSIGPVLAVPGVQDAMRAARDKSVAVSPIVAGAALKGPADRMMRELGHEPSVVGVARLYADIASVLVVDEADADLSSGVEAEGLQCVVTPTIMSAPAAAAALAETSLQAIEK
jgi:LPPG:FO 2-phospho-L-lactate transferase